jgi:hypothetical protein
VIEISSAEALLVDALDRERVIPVSGKADSRRVFPIG